MYKLLRNLWIMGKIDENRINNAVNKDLITQNEADEIMSLNQRK